MNTEIYKRLGRVPYTYLIGWTNHDKWYYGRRTAKGCHPNDLWVNYFTSSKYVAKYREQFGEPDVIEIRKTFDSVEDCCLWEARVLMKLKVFSNDKFLNINENSRWDPTGKTQVRHPDGSIENVSVNDPRYVNGELPHFLKGLERSEAHCKAISASKSGRTRKLDSDETKLKRIATLKAHYAGIREYVTPFGSFNSTKDVAKSLNISQGFAWKIFYRGDSMITLRSAKQSPDFIKQEWISKSWKEVGFHVNE